MSDFTSAIVKRNIVSSEHAIHKSEHMSSFTNRREKREDLVMLLTSTLISDAPVSICACSCSACSLLYECMCDGTSPCAERRNLIELYLTATKQRAVLFALALQGASQ